MKILITGAAGMIGRKLMRQLADDGHLNGETIERVVGFDTVAGKDPGADLPWDFVVGDLSDQPTASSLLASKPDVIFHLAAIVSGEAEADFQRGYSINLDGTRFLFDAIAEAEGYCPRVVFTSSIAVFGAPFPPAIGDDFHTTPLTSYGTQKAIGELLLSDYSRRKLMDGIGIRLPTICVRPGKPNRAASGFFSNIIREPLAGQEAVLPVDDDVRHWHASPQSAVGFLLHAAALNSADVGPRRNLTMPGLSVTVGEQIEALERIGGKAAVDLIQRKPDAEIMKMVAGWPRNFDASRATRLGFSADASFDEIIQSHLKNAGLPLT